ncbi:MAG TPA: hypothetical protein VMV14_08850 [Acidimicrobiales bacterium]|nr:hypothetical protein [Acidimicrobiales bacterium]
MTLRYVVGGTAAAGIVVLSLALSLSGEGPGSTRTFALTGERHVHASVSLTSETWGTSLLVNESGQPGGQIMWVSMRTTSGTWWEAGTFKSVSGHGVEVAMACALTNSRIESVWIKNAAGQVVLHAYLF